MLRVAMLNKLKMAKWWAYHTDTTPRPITVDKRLLYRSAIRNEMRHHRIRKLVEGALACAQDDVWQTPEMWLKSDLTGLDELELMWGQIQQELKTKGAAHGND